MVKHLVAASATALALVVGLGVGAGRVGAQTDADAPHPAHIHSGSCDNLGAIVYPLTDVSPNGLAEGMLAATPRAGTETGTPVAEMGGMAMGAAAAIPVETSYTVVDAPLDKLLSGDYAINVHESAANIGTYIACGDIGGTPTTMPGMAQQGQSLVVGLRELNDSGHAGIAVLQGQGQRTRVILFLAEGLTGEAGAYATPTA